MRKLKYFSLALLLLMVMSAGFKTVNAQDDSPYTLKLRRDWGYGSGMDIQGRMSLSVNGDESQVAAVTFYLDQQVLAEVKQEPFKVSFSTDDYASGVHELSATVLSKAGESFAVKPLMVNFLSSSEAGEKTTKLLVIVGGLVAVSLLVSFLLSSRQKGQPGKASAGVHGLAVCKQCGQTFPRSFFGMNMVVGKFERCPHCGKWQITRRASDFEIALADRKNDPALDVDDQEAEPTTKPVKDELDESRYIDL